MTVAPLVTQREFDLALSANRPLVPMEAAMCILDRQEDDVLNLIELGLVRWAFDLRGKGAERREVRIWRKSLATYASGERFGATTKTAEIGLAQVIGQVLPPAAIIKGTRLLRLFTCSSTHLIGLLEDGELVGSDPKRGPNGSPEITRESVVGFLKRRVL